jgi:hypothetical protein
VKGKYAARAERRREFTGLEGQAVAAERERDRLAAELAELRVSSERRIAGLRAEVSNVRRERDVATSSRLTQLEEVNNRLRAERNDAIGQAKSERDRNSVFQDRLRAFLIGRLGYSVPEARETAFAIFEAADFGRQFVSPAGVARSRNPRVVKGVQRLKGLRGGEDRAADVAPDLEPVVWNRASLRRQLGKLQAEMVEAMLPAYSYDGDASSLALTVFSTGTRISIECTEPDVVADTLIATIELPAAEAAKLVRALNESADDDASEGGDPLGDADRLKPIGGDLAHGPADK